MVSFRAAWADWEAFWDEREHPVSLALVRILLGVCLCYDFLHIWRLDLVVPLFGVDAVGGFSDALMRDDVPWFYRIFPGTELSARGLHAALTLSALAFTVGFFTRTSAVVLLLSWVAFVEVLPYADRGIDTLSRLALIILLFSGAGRWGSIDAWMKTGRIWGDGIPILSAPRRLLVAQVALMYFSAGTQKTGITWWPMGNFAALFFALQDPAVAAFDFSFLRDQPYFFFSQIGVVTTIGYQSTYPLVLLMMWWRRHPERGGRIASFTRRWRLEWIWIGIGGLFHLILAITMNLGIFPWAMLALYPIFVLPEEFLAFWRRLAVRRI